MVRFSRVMLWASFCIPPLFLIIYFVIVSGFGVDLNLTPVIPTGLFGYTDSNGNLHLFVSALGVFDFFTWGWLVKLVVSMVGFVLSVLLLPLNVLLAFIPVFTEQGDSFREARRKAVNYVRFLLYSKQPIHKRWSTLTTLICWILAYATVAVIFIYIMWLTVVSSPPGTWAPLPLPLLLQFTLPKLGDPALLLPFTPLRVFHLATHSGLIFYVFPAVYLSGVLIGLWIVLLFVWVVRGSHDVKENNDTFTRWLSVRE